MSKICGNPDCCVSTGICGSITCGTGELSDNGYWQFSCYECESYYNKEEIEEQCKQYRKRLPYKKRFLLFIHEKLERYCSRKVGEHHVQICKGNRKHEIKPYWLFKLASKIEFKLRTYI